jgi:hypothetical protein
MNQYKYYLTEEQQKELAEEIAKAYIDLQKKYVNDMMYELTTPFWIKWYDKIKLKFKKQ